MWPWGSWALLRWRLLLGRCGFEVVGRELRTCIVLLLAVLVAGAERGGAQWRSEREVLWRVGSSLRMDSLGRDYSFDGACRAVEGGTVYYAELVFAEGESPDKDPVLLDVRYVPLESQITQQAAWVGHGEESSVRLVRARGETRVAVELPAFRVGSAGGVERLAGYRLGWRGKRFTPHVGRGQSFSGKSESVLARGRWVRISVRESGMYKLSYERLKQAGFLDPSSVTLWGLDGRQLSYINRDDGLDDLLQVPLKWYNAGSSDAYALVYLRGPEWWEWNGEKKHYEYHRHEYETHYNYFITDGRPAVQVEEGTAGGAVGQVQSVGWEVSGYQGDGTLLTKNGRERLGKPFSYGQTQVVSAGMDAPIAGMEGRVLVRVAARSSKPSVFRVRSDGRELGTMTLKGIPGTNQMMQKGTVSEGVFTVPSGVGTASVEIEYERPSASAQAWLVKSSFNLPHALAWHGQAFYPYLDSLGRIGEWIGVLIDGVGEGVQVWDISDFFRPRSFSSSSEVQVGGGMRSQLAVFSMGEVKEPTYHDAVANQNLHGMRVPELLIVSHGDFLSQAEQVAQIYRQSPLTRLNVEVVDVEKVYNEFSAGLKDATAIRNFCRMLYWRGGGASGAFKYLLLFGKPSRDLYDSEELTNFVPNYQTIDSYDATYSFGSDDYFALLDEGEGEVYGGMDIGVGRYAVQDEDEAEAVLLHERAYHDSRNWGPWLSRAVFLADDGDGLTYMKGSDSLARDVERCSPATNVRKLYSDAFKQETYWYKMVYPTLRDAFNAELRRGAFLVNYIGHGSELIMMHEVVSTRDNYLQWNNLTTLPVMVAASCRMAVYDQYASSSFTSDAVYRPQGGLMALIASSQYSYSGANFDFNARLMQSIYPAATGNKCRMLGEAVAKAKNMTADAENKRKYILLGNPALPLLSADAKVELESVGTSEESYVAKDTVRGGGRSVLNAHVEDIGGKPFDGMVYVEVQGPKEKITTHGNDLEEPFEFEDRTTTLFRGKATARNGQVRFTWLTPRDADFQYGNGRISLFAASKEGLAAGSYDKVIVGGQSAMAITDTQGPIVKIYLNDEAKRKQYSVGRNPLLIVRLSDESGINCSGAAQGHNLLLELTHEASGASESVVLNDFYTADENTYQQGRIQYQLTNLQEGKYHARVTAWDAVNNKGTEEFTFDVVLNQNARVENLLNYPNPFTEATAFYLDVTSNEQPVEVLIQIFSVDGQLVRTLRHYDPTRQGRIGPIYWDGTDSYGRRIARGVYFYRAKVHFCKTKDLDPRSVERYEKLVLL